MKKMLYSEKLNKMYNEEDLELLEKEEAEFDAAEKAKADAKAERKRRAEEVEAARKAIEEAQANYAELVNKFVEDYGSYHYSQSKKLALPTRSLFDMMFNDFWGF
jgi:hypothetical protein